MATFKKNAKGVKEILQKKYDTFKFDGPWSEAFGEPERKGIWIIWGNSGSGKSTFVMQLCKYLCKFDKVAYNSMEEGDCKTMQNTMVNCGMGECNKRFLLIANESIEELTIRLQQPRSPRIVVIDSFQYTQLSYKRYIEFKEQFPHKLIIFISHADGKLPAGRAAKSVMYDATLKIYVEGYRAFSKGRYFGSKKQIDVWPEEVIKYWGNNENNEKQSGDAAANQSDTCSVPQYG